MSVAALKKGWCPTLMNPMPSGDGWLARLKPRGATLSVEQAKTIAQLATAHGNGQIDLTSRANLQIRGLTPESAVGFAEMAIVCGLAASDPQAERIRNILASPLGADDRQAEFDSHAVANELETLLQDRTLAALPDKFGILVDGGGALPLSGINADITIRPAYGRLALSLDGGKFAALCTLHHLIDNVRKLVTAYLDLAGQNLADRDAPRTRALVKAGRELSLFAAAGLAVSLVPRVNRAATQPIGFMALPGKGQGGFSKGAFGAGLAFGRIDADTLAALADLATAFGDATLRATPWRALLLVGVDASAVPALAKEIAALGLITEPDDPRRFIAACVGRPACASAQVDARGDALRLAGVSALAGLDIHVSGCAKGCAHPARAEITLAGRDGHYDLIRKGRAGDRPEARGLSLDEAISLLTEKVPA